MIVYRCDHCRDEIGSIIRITVDATGSDQPEHFCSITCLVEWAVTNRVDVPGLRPGAAPEPVPPAPERDSGGDREATAVADHPAATADRSESKMPAAGGTALPQGAVEHTCELCGRVGTRRYVQTSTGWKCAPTSAQKCAQKAAAKANAKPNCRGRQPAFTPQQDTEIANRYANGESVRDLATAFGVSRPTIYNAINRAATAAVRASDIPAKQFQPKVTPPPQPAPTPPPAPAKPTPPVTARCEDCTRTWTLTGRVLAQAVEMHELKHGHIVNAIDHREAQRGA